MKKIAAATLIIIGAGIALSQPPIQREHRVVFQMNSPGQPAWNELLGNVKNIRAAFAAEGIRVNVVFFGAGLNMVVKRNNPLEERLREFAAAGVTFSVCRNSMEALSLKESDLLDFVSPVDSGVAELVRKQEDNWSYIKAGR